MAPAPDVVQTAAARKNATARRRNLISVADRTSGASRARTGDLRAASATLSQLSYGPVPRQSSGRAEGALSGRAILRRRAGALTLDDMRHRAVLLPLALLVLAVALFAPRHSNSRGPYPADPVRSPGVLNPVVTQATIDSTICTRGWTRTIRPPTSYTNELKRRQMRQYGVGGSLSDYQEDHLISLELGGHPTDPRNLWPEPYPRAAQVDRVENELNDMVCSGELSLDDAQRRESALKHTDG